MILVDIGPEQTFYRAFNPRWAYAPESGAGAALAGGRFNRPGVEARYLADSADGALQEYRAEAPLLPPATLVSFLVTETRIVDFRSGFDGGLWPEIWSDAYCNWKAMAFLDDTEPPSWVIGDLVREASHAGLLYRSARNPGIACLVLFPEMSEHTRFTATVYDPEQLLPRNAESWRAQ